MLHLTNTYGLTQGQNSITEPILMPTEIPWDMTQPNITSLLKMEVTGKSQTEELTCRSGTSKIHVLQ